MLDTSGYRRNARRAAAALLVAIALILPTVSAAAPTVQPWMPSGIDSLNAWAAQARALFRANTGDSLGGTNYIPYEFVGKIGRNLLKSLGRANLPQAKAVEAVMDSLGLSVEVAVDPLSPYFALIMARNPFRATADVSGFLFWYQGPDLRIQGVKFNSGRDVLMRVWRTGYPDKPYSWGVIENARHGTGPLQLTLLRLAETGYFWTADQYPGRGKEVGARGDAAFADLNNDGVPELITWTEGPKDSAFAECMGCPKLVTETVWTERETGYEPSETRLVTSTYATFVLFVRFLREGNRAAAARLLEDPRRLEEAFANGWGKAAGRADWQIVNAEPGETWPHWIVVRHGHGHDLPSWVVHFTVKDGRWIIKDWLKEQQAAPKVQVR